MPMLNGHQNGGPIDGIPSNGRQKIVIVGLGMVAIALM